MIEKILIFGLLFSLVIVIIAHYQIISSYETEISKITASNQMLQDTAQLSNTDTGLLTGYADITSGYYCVVTDGRTLNEINNTIVHEECHLMIDDQPQHFCKWYI